MPKRSSKRSKDAQQLARSVLDAEKEQSSAEIAFASQAKALQLQPAAIKAIRNAPRSVVNQHVQASRFECGRNSERSETVSFPIFRFCGVPVCVLEAPPYLQRCRRCFPTMVGPEIQRSWSPGFAGIQAQFIEHQIALVKFGLRLPPRG